VAVIIAGFNVRILRLLDDGTFVQVLLTPLPKTTHQVLSHLITFKFGSWKSNSSAATVNDASPELPLLLFSDGIRLIIVNTTELAPNMGWSTSVTPSPTTGVIADYHLGDQFGKLSYAAFVFNDKRILTLFELGASASMLSLSKPHRDDIPGPKFQSDRGLASSSDGRSIAVLLRSKGQDQIVVLGLKNDDIQVQATFNTRTNDAQELKWSPNQDPVLAVVESAAYGMKVLFFSALGHPLQHLEVSPFDNAGGVSGVGLSNWAWATVHNGSKLAIADGEKRVLVRHQQDKMMVFQTPKVFFPS
jgi:hypothetical protein